MSESLSPASLMAFSAASACSWICDVLGMTPSSVVSAAPTMATWFLRICLSLRRTEQGKGDPVVELFERDFQIHIEFERLGRLRAVNDIGHHPWTLVQFDHGDRIRRRETGGGTMVNDVAVELTLAARLEDGDLAGGAGGAERARREIDVGAGVATLQAQLACLRAVPEVLRFGCRFRSCARWLSHVG